MPEIYPISSGKGGVGKSFVTASLGGLLAKMGKNVVLVDLDLGASNLHTFLGIKNPKNGMNSFLNKTVKSLEDVTVPTIIPNLFFISSSYCSMEIANLYYFQKLKIINAIRKLPFDNILLDLGSGTNFNTLDFFLISNKGIFICTPEPTSIENSLRFVKAAYLRKLKQIIKRHAFNSVVKSIVDNPNNVAIKSPDIIEAVLKNDPNREKFLLNKLNEIKFKFIINKFRKNKDANIGKKIETVCNRHFYSNFQFLGNIRYDEWIHDAIVSKEVYVQKYPYTKSSIDMKKIADKITNNTEPVPLKSKIS
ncbi:MAG: P-loop NTPase [Deltaproteobacteria bacterium]|nr:P-loop NTPase [Deltaproteobacteria bacterium]